MAGMKVPTYRRQTSLPKSAGSGMLSVQASPAALGAVGAAAEEQGKVVEAQALTWGAHLLKVDRAGEQAKQMNSFRADLAKQRGILMRSNPDGWRGVDGKHLNVFQKLQQTQKILELGVSSQAGMIADKAVRTRFVTQAQIDIVSMMTSVRPLLTKRMFDFTKAETGRLLDTAKRDLSMTPYNEKEGSPWSLKWGSFNESKEYFKSLGNWTALDDYKYDTGAMNDIEELRYRKDLLDAGRDIASLTALQQRLSDPTDSSRFMDEDRRIKLIESLERRIATETTREIAAKTRKDNQDWVEKERKRQTAEEEVLDAIAKSRKYWDLPIEERPSEVPEVPTVTDIRGSRELDPKVKTALVEAIVGAKEIVNWSRIAAIKNQIDQAVTGEDLDNIRTQVGHDIANRVIGIKGWKQSIEDIQKARDKTPEHKQIKRFRNLLNGITTKFSTAAAGGQRVTLGPEGSTAMMKFEELLTQGARPVDAFYEAYKSIEGEATERIELIRHQMDSKVQDALKELPSEASSFIGIPADVAAKFSAARTAWKALAKGLEPKKLIAADLDLETYKLTPEQVEEFKLDKRDRIRVRSLYRSEMALNEMEAAYDTAKITPPPAKVTDLDLEAKNTSTWYDDVLDFFTPGDPKPRK